VVEACGIGIELAGIFRNLCRQLFELIVLLALFVTGLPERFGQIVSSKFFDFLCFQDVERILILPQSFFESLGMLIEAFRNLEQDGVVGPGFHHPAACPILSPGALAAAPIDAGVNIRMCSHYFALPADPGLN